MKFTCEACGKTVEQDAGPVSGAVPAGWRIHDIEGERLLLCLGCAHSAHFIGGLSPVLKTCWLVDPERAKKVTANFA